MVNAETSQVYPVNHFFHPPSVDCDACFAYKEVHQRISDLEKQLAKLKEEERVVFSQMNIRHDHFQKIPMEILFRIFEELLVDNQLNHSPRPFGLLDLGRVCRYWRQVTWETPYLWSKPTFIINGVDYDEEAELDKRNFEKQVELFRDYLTRSGTLPLSISILYDTGRHWVDVPSDVIVPLCEAMAKPDVISRIIYLDLDLPTSCLKYFNRVKAKNLKTFAYYQLHSDDEHNLELAQFINGVEKLTIHSKVLRDHILHINFPKLTDFEASSWSLAHLIQLMRHAPNLQKCVCGVEDTSTGLLPDSHSALPHMSHLDIYTVQSMGSLLDHFTFPNLQFLKLKARVIDPQNLASFLKRSQCRLTNLAVSAEREWTIANLEPLLASPQTISCLDLHTTLHSTPIPKIFQTIFTSSAADHVIPNAITEFNCEAIWRASNTWDFIPSLFGPMIHSHEKRSARIKLGLIMSSPYDDVEAPWMPEEVVGIIRELEAQGWQWFVSVRYRGVVLKDLVTSSSKRHKSA